MAPGFIAKAQIDAINRHDSQALAALYAEDATVHDPMYPEPLKGRDAVREDAEVFWSAFPDLTISPNIIIQSGDVAAWDGTSTATHTGPLAGPDGEIPPTNRAITMPIAVFSDLNSQGLVSEERRYYDVAGVMQQLGLLEQ